MISIVRGRARDQAAQQTVLQELVDLRAEHLPGIRAIRQERELKQKDFKGKNSTLARDALYEDQHRKCAYCECQGRKDYDHLEHFRPKVRADRRPGHPIGEGYYWLAWAWDNLLFACGDCNFKKNTRFPLAPGCAPLSPEDQPPGREHPWLLDPGDPANDPFDHIRFALMPLLDDQTQWRAVPRNGSYHGYWIIKVLKLNRAGLLDQYERHVALLVEQAVERIREAHSRALATRDVVRLRDIWDREVGWLCDPGQPFIALSCDALNHFFPTVFRRRFDLPEPRPDFRRIRR